MRVLVCGSRTWFKYAPICERLEVLPPGSTVIHGGANGADWMAGRIAKVLGLHVEVWHADWDTYGRRAGIVRNRDMLASRPDKVLAFWDGRSRGTAHTIREAKRMGIDIEVVIDG